MLCKRDCFPILPIFFFYFLYIFSLDHKHEFPLWLLFLIVGKGMGDGGGEGCLKFFGKFPADGKFAVAQYLKQFLQRFYQVMGRLIDNNGAGF